MRLKEPMACSTGRPCSSCLSPAPSHLSHVAFAPYSMNAGQEGSCHLRRVCTMTNGWTSKIVVWKIGIVRTCRNWCTHVLVNIWALTDCGTFIWSRADIVEPDSGNNVVLVMDWETRNTQDCGMQCSVVVNESKLWLLMGTGQCC